MEEPYDLEDWLAFLVGANIWVDFSTMDEFSVSFEKLIKQITAIEEKLATRPRKYSES